jgi:small subunit ribosomal protein S6
MMYSAVFARSDNKNGHTNTMSPRAARSVGLQEQKDTLSRPTIDRVEARCHSIRSYASQRTTLNTYVIILLSNLYPVLSFYAPQRQIKSLVRLAATHILNNGGVVRGIQYWGTETLPQRMRSHGTNHEYGEYVRSSFSYPF